MSEKLKRKVVTNMVIKVRQLVRTKIVTQLRFHLKKVVARTFITKSNIEKNYILFY